MPRNVQDHVDRHVKMLCSYCNMGTGMSNKAFRFRRGRGGRMDDEHVSHATEHADLKRGIGPWLLFFFVLGDIVGAGIYALVGEVGAVVGGAIWSAFLCAFVLAIFTASSYAELVPKYPRAGG